MTSLESLQIKIADLKAKVEQNSISPLLLGSILEELLGATVRPLDWLYKVLDRYYVTAAKFAPSALGVKLRCVCHDPVDDSTEDVEVDFPMASSDGAGAMSAEQAQILERLAKHGLTSLSLKRNEAGVLVLEYTFYNPATGRETKEVQVAPLATASSSGFMSAEQAKTVSDAGTASRAFLAVGPDGELVAHGVGAFLKQGLTPVVFRHLRRVSKETASASTTIERRWTRFTKLPDAVVVDAVTGVVSFRDDLLSPDERPTEGHHISGAHALLVRESGGIASVVYGRKFFELFAPQDWRMLVFDFVLGFVDLSSERPARRWTLADTPVRLPFQVRFTPVYAYDSGIMQSAEAHFGFEVR